MRQIKTIWWNIQNSGKFDDEVNKAISDGWSMTARMVMMPKIDGGYPLLYAELEREVYELDGVPQED